MANSQDAPDNQAWPPLPFPEWSDTCSTLHMWFQIVGKIRMVQTPWTNHAWNVTLYLTARGLTTSPIPYGTRLFGIDFDFIDHELRIDTSDGMRRMIPLRARAVADMYDDVFAQLADLGMRIRINAVPNEVVEAIPFTVDRKHASYDPVFANRYFRALAQADRVFKKFRARFIGKNSPVHLFWGSMDLATTRFSGRTAPAHPGGIPNCPDWVTRDAYSHEVSSCGFWPGNEQMPEAVFYSYAYPEPTGFKSAAVRPSEARYDAGFGEFVLPYEVVRQAQDPDAVLLDFLQSTYEAAADLAKWDRRALEATAEVPRS
ncbi:DUF5996 family protein [Massilia horti]|uniref:Ava_C0101 and related proteins n=1 Tax=Massilia horti TaxID=2562153 RepID=A0A4Y9T1I0_9BURK|nr:DUF5996 family protein [Massilia horti]TFW32847.1 hypothetical protein E4O92_07935 [Massilia horti]